MDKKRIFMSAERLLNKGEKKAIVNKTSPKTPVVAKINKKLESEPAPELPPDSPGLIKPYSFCANLKVL